MNKTITIKIKVKGKDVPDWGLGQGILVEQDIELKEEVTEQNQYRYYMMLHERYHDLIKEHLEMIVEGDDILSAD